VNYYLIDILGSKRNTNMGLYWTLYTSGQYVLWKNIV